MIARRAPGNHNAGDRATFLTSVLGFPGCEVGTRGLFAVCHYCTAYLCAAAAQRGTWRARGNAPGTEDASTSPRRRSPTTTCPSPIRGKKFTARKRRLVEPRSARLWAVNFFPRILPPPICFGNQQGLLQTQHWRGP